MHCIHYPLPYCFQSYIYYNSLFFLKLTGGFARRSSLSLTGRGHLGRESCGRIHRLSGIQATDHDVFSSMLLHLNQQQSTLIFFLHFIPYQMQPVIGRRVSIVRTIRQCCCGSTCQDDERCALLTLLMHFASTSNHLPLNRRVCILFYPLFCSDVSILSYLLLQGLLLLLPFCPTATAATTMAHEIAGEETMASYDSA